MTLSETKLCPDWAMLKPAVQLSSSFQIVEARAVVLFQFWPDIKSGARICHLHWAIKGDIVEAEILV